MAKSLLSISENGITQVFKEDLKEFSKQFKFEVLKGEPTSVKVTFSKPVKFINKEEELLGMEYLLQKNGFIRALAHSYDLPIQITKINKEFLLMSFLPLQEEENPHMFSKGLINYKRHIFMIFHEIFSDGLHFIK